MKPNFTFIQICLLAFGIFTSKANSALFQNPPIDKITNPVKSVSGFKYWFDNDFENASLLGPPSSNEVYELTIQTPSGLKNGFHTFNYMVHQNDDKWSAPVSSLFYYFPGAQNICEYWYDNDFEDRQSVHFQSGDYIIINNEMLDFTPLTNGYHQFNARFKMENGYWSAVQSSTFFKQGKSGNENTETKIVEYEYWADNHYPAKTTVQVPETDELALTNQMLDLSNLSNGFHQINLRTKSNTGFWSGITSENIFKRGNDVNSVMDAKKLRYWFDEDLGTAKEIEISGQNGIIDNPAVDCTGTTQGKHQLNCQIMDNGNVWSSVISDSVEVFLADGLFNIFDNNTTYFYYYPNPTQGKVTVKIPGEDNIVNIEIVTTSGVLLRKEIAPINTERLIYVDISNFKIGTYILNIKAETVHGSIKLIKK